MKKLFSMMLMLLSLVFVSVSMTACEPDPEGNGENGEVSITVDTPVVDANTVSVAVATTGISEYAYLLQGSGDAAPIEAVIFKGGTVVTATDGTSTIVLEDLEYDSSYTLYIAARKNKGGFYGEVLEADFSTIGYSEDVTIIRYNYDGADIHVKIPEAVKARGNKLKWMVSSVPDNKKWKPAATGYFTDAEIIQQNEKSYPAFLINRDTTLRIREENRVVDLGDDNYIEYYSRISPGEPLIVSIQEVLYTTDDSNTGWGAGWYGTPFLWEQFINDYYAATGGGGASPWKNFVETRALPNEENYWPEDSWHQTLHITSKQPEMLDASVEVGITGYNNSPNLTAKGGFVTLKPEEGVYCYCVSILDHALYQTLLLQWLGGKKDQVQWFVTSMFAAYEGLASTVYASAGPAAIDISEWFGGSVNPGGHYHVLVTAMGSLENELGVEADPSRQSFVHYEFDIPNYTLPAPEIKVTGLESDNPFLARFNVKCTNSDVAPLEKASFACNYARDFNLYINSYGYTYSQLVEMNTLAGVYLDDSDVQKINSPEGLLFEVSSREDAISGLVVMGWNTEARPSNPDAEDSQAYAEARTPAIPDAERVESPLFTDLLGEWTATATLHYVETKYVVDANGNYVKDEEGNYVVEKIPHQTETKSKVVLGDITYPEALSQEVYDLYSKSGVSKTETDAYFANFKDLAVHNNQKIRGQNRILCQGLDFDAAETSYKDILNYQSPWDLFVSPSYTCSSVDDNFYDFGPKWYIQIDKNGNLFVPVNMNRLLPLTNWQGAEVHFIGYNPDTNEALIAPQTDSNDASTWPNFPVEVSADKNTLTIKPHVYDSGEGVYTFYPNMIINTNSVYGMVPMAGKIKGNIVLTRGWNEGGATTITVSGTTENTTRTMSAAPVKSANGAKVVEKSKIQSRTSFASFATDKPAVKYNKIDVKPINREKFVK